MTVRLTGSVAIWDVDGERSGDLMLEGGVGRSGPALVELDVSGCVVTPGLVNAHHHLLQTAFRTLPGTRGVPMSDWLGVMAGAYAAAGHDPELYELAATAGAAEGLLCGVTTIADHHLNWPRSVSADETVSLAAATVTGALSAGGRLCFVRGSAGDDPEWAAASAEAICQELLGARGATGTADPRTVGGVRADGRLQLAVGPAGVHSDAEPTFRALAEVARRWGLRRRTQANEQVDVLRAAERYGRRPLELLDDWGWLSSEVTLAHLCEVTSDEIALLADRGVSATHAPGCDVPMGWGIAPVAELLAAGVPVGLGTSGGGSNDAGHLLADARLAMQVSGLAGAQLPARTVLAAATAGSAAGLGRTELGHLGPGSAGDACVWDVSGVADVGVQDPVAGLLWASPGRRPRHVVVGGELVVRDGELLRVDGAEVAARLRERLAWTPPV